MHANTFGFVGAGLMAEAIARSLVSAKLFTPAHILASDVAEPRRQLFESLGIRATQDNRAVVRQADALLIAVKPQNVPDLLKEIGPDLRAGHLVITICAGVPTAVFEAAASAPVRVVRAMPNQPIRVGRGMTALCRGRHTTDDDMKFANAVFSAGGKAVEVKEEMIDAVTAISGSGPAYFYFLVEVLIEAGIREGLPPDVAKTLAVQTAHGAAEVMNVEYHVPPEEHRRRVTSKGGTTEAAFRKKEEHRVREGLLAAFHAAAERARELGGRK